MLAMGGNRGLILPSSGFTTTRIATTRQMNRNRMCVCDMLH